MKIIDNGACPNKAGDCDDCSAVDCPKHPEFQGEIEREEQSIPSRSVICLSKCAIFWLFVLMTLSGIYLSLFLIRCIVFFKFSS